MSVRDRSRRPLSLLAAQAALALFAGSLAVVATQSPAAASTCSHAHSDKDPGSEQVVGAGGTGLAMRTGPHTTCAEVVRVPNTHWVTLECWDYGTTVNGVSSWSFARYGNGTSSWTGWLSDAYLTNSGSSWRC